MNISIPVIEAMVRLEFWNQMDPEHQGTYAPVQIFGAASIPGQTPLFHSFADDGGIYWRCPIHAFCSKETDPMPLTELVLWDSFSYHCQATCFDLLRNKRLSYVAPSGTRYSGVYLFTLDWFGDSGASNGFAEVPGQHKAGHVLQLDNGNYAIQPNNRLVLEDPNFVTKKLCYPRKLARHLYSSENQGLTFEDTENYETANVP